MGKMWRHGQKTISKHSIKQGYRGATTDAIVTGVGQCRHWFEALLHNHPRNTKQLPSAQARNANLELRQGRFCWTLLSCRHKQNQSFTIKHFAHF